MTLTETELHTFHVEQLRDDGSWMPLGAFTSPRYHRTADVEHYLNDGHHDPGRYRVAERKDGYLIVNEYDVVARLEAQPLGE